MKKALMISSVVYMGLCVGICAAIIVAPEAYGKWVGKMTNGIFKAFEEE